MKFTSRNILLRKDFEWRESLAKFLAVALVVGIPFNSFGESINGPILCAALFKKDPTSISNRSSKSNLDVAEQGLSIHGRWTMAPSPGSHFNLGSAEKPAYLAFQKYFKGISDPENFLAQFEATRVSWNKAHQNNLNNMPTEAMKPALEEVERLLRQEGKPRKVVQAFIQRGRELKAAGAPYADSHGFILEVSKFLSHRNQPSLHLNLADLHLRNLARDVLPNSTYQTLIQEFYRLGRGGNVKAREVLYDLRRKFLAALDEAAKTEMGQKRLAEMHKQYVSDQQGLAFLRQRDAELSQLRKAGHKLTTEENHALMYASFDIERLEKSPPPSFASDKRREAFYEAAQQNRLPTDLQLGTVFIKEPVEISFGVVVPTAGFVSFRGQAEGMMFGVETVGLIRRAAHVDDQFLNSTEVIYHDNIHRGRIDVLRKKILELPTESKRRILNGIDQITDRRQKEMAELTFYIALHEDASIVIARSTFELIQNRLNKLLVKGYTDTEVYWMADWFDQLRSYLER